MGKGSAIRRAILEMTGDVVIFQDADLEYNPEDYPRMLRPILENKAEVVFGSRFTGEERKVLYFWHTLTNRFLTLFSNMLNDTNFTDMETCYKAFTAASLRSMPLVSNRFGIEPEVAAKVARNGFRMFEVPINYNGRRYDEGKKITWRDGLAALWFIVKYRFSSNYCDAGKIDARRHRTGAEIQPVDVRCREAVAGVSRVAELGVGRGKSQPLHSRPQERPAHGLPTRLPDRIAGPLAALEARQDREARYDGKRGLRATARLRARQHRFPQCPRASRR